MNDTKNRMTRQGRRVLVSRLRRWSNQTGLLGARLREAMLSAANEIEELDKKLVGSAKIPAEDEVLAGRKVRVALQDGKFEGYPLMVIDVPQPRGDGKVLFSLTDAALIEWPDNLAFVIVEVTNRD